MSKARDLADLAKNANDRLDTVATSDGALSNRNLIINGAMQVAQRGTSATSVSTEGYKTVDRYKWTMDSTSAVFTLSQSTDVPSGQGFANSFKAEVTSEDTSLAAGNQTRFEYRFEGQDVQQLAKGTSDAKKVTLSFWVKAFQTGTYIVNLYDNDNNRLIAATYTVDTSATWEYKTITFDGDTSGALTNDGNLSLVIQWFLAAGSDFTSGTLPSDWESYTAANRAAGQTVDIADSTSNYWAITGVQLEVGDTATPFEHRSYGDELARCERYFQRSWHTAANSGNGQTYPGAVVGRAVDTATVNVQVQFRTQLRTAPSFTVYRAGVADDIWVVNTAGTVSSVSLGQNWFDANGISGFTTSGNPLTAGYMYGFDYDVEAEL